MTRNDSVYERFKDNLRQVLEQTIDDWFYRSQNELGINAGDVAPDEQFLYDKKLDELCIQCKRMLRNQDEQNDHMSTAEFFHVNCPDFILHTTNGELAYYRDEFLKAIQVIDNYNIVCACAYDLRLMLLAIKDDYPDWINAAFECIDNTVKYYIECNKEEED